jgi:ferritin
MDDELLQAFLDQVGLEQASAQAYLQMAVWAQTHDLTGTASWLRSQAAEEAGHAHRFLDFLLNRGVEVRLQPLAAPRADFDGVVAVFEAALAHEQLVTESIGKLYAAAQASGDYQSLPLLSWFLTEQVEEESSVRTIVGELRLAHADPTALLLLDRELPSRRDGPAG